LCGEKKEDTVWLTESLIPVRCLDEVGPRRIRQAFLSDYVGDALANDIDDRPNREGKG